MKITRRQLSFIIQESLQEQSSSNSEINILLLPILGMIPTPAPIPMGLTVLYLASTDFRTFINKLVDDASGGAETVIKNSTKEIGSYIKENLVRFKKEAEDYLGGLWNENYKKAIKKNNTSWI